MQNFPKLLRTLFEHKAFSLLLHQGHTPRIHYAGEWLTLPEHPPVDLKEGLEQLRPLLSESSWTDFENMGRQVVDYRESRFHLRLQENNNGELLVVELLKPLPSQEEWPTAVFDWLAQGAYLEVHHSELYAAILQHQVDRNRAVVSLEESVLYPLKSTRGFVHQKEAGRDFTTLKEGLKQAFALKPNCIGIQSTFFSEKELSVLKALSPKVAILVLMK